MVAESKGDISQLPLQQGVIMWLKSGQWNLSSRDVHLLAVPLKGRGVFSLPLPGSWSVGVGWWSFVERAVLGLAEQQGGSGLGPWCCFGSLRVFYTRDETSIVYTAVCFPWRPKPHHTEPGRHWAGCDPLTQPLPEPTHLCPQQQFLPRALSKQEIWVGFYVMRELAFTFSFSAGSTGERTPSASSRSPQPGVVRVQQSFGLCPVPLCVASYVHILSSQ